jgi:hypothetical protein
METDESLINKKKILSETHCYYIHLKIKVLYLNKTQCSNLNHVNTRTEVWTNVRKTLCETTWLQLYLDTEC